jgi:hypothetical protein
LICACIDARIPRLIAVGMLSFGAEMSWCVFVRGLRAALPPAAEGHQTTCWGSSQPRQRGPAVTATSSQAPGARVSHNVLRQAVHCSLLSLKFIQVVTPRIDQVLAAKTLAESEHRHWLSGETGTLATLVSGAMRIQPRRNAYAQARSWAHLLLFQKRREFLALSESRLCFGGLRIAQFQLCVFSTLHRHDA